MSGHALAKPFSDLTQAEVKQETDAIIMEYADDTIADRARLMAVEIFRLRRHVHRLRNTLSLHGIVIPQEP